MIFRFQCFSLSFLQWIFVLLQIFLLIFCRFTIASALPISSDTLPNIIILLADDLGYGDLSCYGSQSIYTPHLDALAADGRRFVQFYAASAVCSPSRAALLTGRYPLRFDIRQHFTDNAEHLPESATTLPELLQNRGYRTAHIGKWHLGGLRPKDYEARIAGRTANPGPLQHGFDHYLTNIEGAPIRPQLIRERRLYREGGKTMVRNDQRAKEDLNHWTEIKINEAIAFIEEEKSKTQPFFINLWFDVPHTPYEPAPEPHLSRYKNLGDEGDQLYFRSMVSHLDAQIGRLIDYLKSRNLYKNTLILFTSDNGPAYQGSPGPFKGGKTDLHEGGIRVPMFVVWPEHITTGTHTFQTMHMVDILPTISDLVGIDTGGLKLDGKSMRKDWTKGEELATDHHYWQMDLYTHFQNQGPKPTPYATSVVRWKAWKLLANGEEPVALYNLAADHREIYNLLGKQPELEKELTGKLVEFLNAERDRSGFKELGQ